jgi:hypothetical protein
MPDKASYIQEVARYPGGRRSRHTNPLPFILWTRHSHLRIGDYLSMFTPLDPPCSVPTGSPRVGCGSSPRTGGLGCREDRTSATHGGRSGALYRPLCPPSATERPGAKLSRSTSSPGNMLDSTTRLSPLTPTLDRY